jgi:rhodanese-related sulfurtransferase
MTEPLALLLEKAQRRKLYDGDEYAGDVTSREVFEYIMSHDDGILIDVRTEAEWANVGAPHFPENKNPPVLLSWRKLPDMTLNMAFASELKQRCSDEKTPLFFLCRSGVRSKDAANEMTKQGYLNCFNIVAGFEGTAQVADIQAQVLGWKAEGLPWA